MHKYEKMADQLRQLIESGQLPAGAKLPSIRDLSKQFTTSKSTVLAALGKLEDKHLIYAIPKSGYYVVHHPKPVSSSPTDVIDFAGSSPVWHDFPYSDFMHCIMKSIDTYQEDLFRYGTLSGLPSLIQEAKKLLQTYQVFAHERNLFITPGVQQALSILSIMPFPNHRSTLLVEQPGYHLYMDMIHTYPLHAVGIRRSVSGIDLDELEQLFKRENIKFFYTMPRFHNPLGTSYSNHEKKAILQLAHKYDVYIVEDDYLADFESDRKQDPLFALDTEERVIYLKSFSKIMFPGLRIGIAVLPSSLCKTYQSFTLATHIDSSMISQAALELYLKSGMFERYRTQVSQAYKNRAVCLQQALDTYLPQYDKPSELSMNSHVVLPREINTRSLIEDLRQQQVLLEPIDPHYLNGFYRERLLKLHVSNVDPLQIEAGIEKIAQALTRSKNLFT
ncbi:aminotransferase-like domain-containing protein [Marinicrinis sediminis]|uniref:PLP-dependent aminotransferase family protein n=1 Tax=Marinicrinis sediminis TaxID=1652465 RepID=A0ABW5RE76_9BACL